MMQFKYDKKEPGDYLNLHKVGFFMKDGEYEWSMEGTGNKSGNDNHMNYEVIIKLKRNGKEIVNERKYISEYSDAKIEFQNTCRFLQPKNSIKQKYTKVEEWGDVLIKMKY